MRCMVIYLVGLQFSELGAEINKPCSHNAGASFVQIQHCWSHSILDNMCHLDNLKVAREPLPLPGDHKYIWQDITKIIDELHIRNHKDSRCRTKYNPEVVKTISKTTNTMSCEQTFAWLSRFKKVICAMPKTHFHFFLHRMIKRRNLYITYCYANNRRPLQPSIKVKI